MSFKEGLFTTCLSDVAAREPGLDNWPGLHRDDPFPSRVPQPPTPANAFHLLTDLAGGWMSELGTEQS